MYTHFSRPRKTTFPCQSRARSGGNEVIQPAPLSTHDQPLAPMHGLCPCCAQGPAVKTTVPAAALISIRFVRENLCIARCDNCGTWLANDNGVWEPLLRYQRDSTIERLNADT